MIILLAALLPSLAPQGTDWPQWRGPTRDGILPAKGIMLTKLPDQPKAGWNRKSGEGLSSAVLANTKIEKFNKVPIKEMRADALTQLNLSYMGIGAEGAMGTMDRAMEHRI